MCVAEARCPDASVESMKWYPVWLQERNGASPMPGIEVSRTTIRVVTGAQSGMIPKLILTAPQGTWLSGNGEWQRHVRFISLLGMHLARLYGIPEELWRRRVLPSVLPTPMSF